MKENMRKNEGLTLIEVVVVMSIVAILAALLIPAAQHSRATARQITCMDNLKSLGQSFSASLAQSGGALPNVYYSFEKDATETKVTLKSGASEADELFSYVPDANVMTCPNDTKPVAVRAKSEDGKNISAPASYAYNISLPLLYRNISRVYRPLETAVFYDGDAESMAGSWSFSLNWADETVAYRHRGAANCVFMDGHVESYTTMPQWAFSGGEKWLAFSIETIDGHTIVGETDIEANPNFFLLTLPDGTELDVQSLKNKELKDYSGPASLWRIKPKGSSEALITVDGDPYPLDKNTVYTITAKTMTVNLWNDKRDKNGYACGHWLIRIVEAKNADIETD